MKNDGTLLKERLKVSQEEATKELTEARTKIQHLEKDVQLLKVRFLFFFALL